MEYIYLAIIFIFLVVLAKSIFVKTEEEIITVEEQKKDKIKDIPIEKDCPKKEVFYEMDTASIKLNLYSLSNFRSYNLRDLYTKFVINKYWLDEPFHSSFANILLYIDSCNLWIKSPKSKEIIINLRGADNEMIHAKSIKVLDIKDVVNKIILDIFHVTNNILTAENIQIILLSSIIFVLSKVGNIKMLVEESITTEEKWNYLIETFFGAYSDMQRMKIVPKNNSNFKLIEDCYNKVVANLWQYPNYIENNKSDLKDTPRLVKIHKKGLVSISNY